MKMAIPSTKPERETLVKTIISRFDASQKYCDEKHSDFLRYYKIYKSMADEVDSDQDDKDDDFRIILPYLTGVVDTAASKITEPLLQGEGYSILPKKPQDEPKRDNQLMIERQYRSMPSYQDTITRIGKQTVITGNSFELAEWQIKSGKRKSWRSVDAEDEQGKPYKALREVEIDAPDESGLSISQISVFDAYPEPDVNDVDKMQWFIIVNRRVALEDLQSRKWLNPTTGKLEPVYFLDDLINDKRGSLKPKQSGDTTIRPEAASGDQYQKGVKQLDGAGAGDETTQTEDDIDAITEIVMFTPDAIYSVANNKYLIRAIKDPFHVPRIPIIHRRHNLGEGFWGVGVIEVSENIFFMMNDALSLAMQNWFRMVFSQEYVHKNAIVDENDLSPRHKGMIRIDSGLAIGDVVMPRTQVDVTGSMLAVTSNFKGMIEHATAVADYSPGTDGTKQYHKTATGLVQIDRELATRFKTSRRLQIAAMIRESEEIERLFLQFQIQPAAFPKQDNSGKYIGGVDLSWEDIYTDGRSFWRVITEDPAFGDNDLERQLMMIFLKECENYEGFRKKANDPSIPQVMVGDVMRRLCRTFGWKDTSAILKDSKGVVTPETELMEMLEGKMPMPNPNENAIQHAAMHLLQKNSPMVQEGLQTGKIQPETIARLDQHIALTMQMIQSIMGNLPSYAAQLIAQQEAQS